MRTYESQLSTKSQNSSLRRLSSNKSTTSNESSFKNAENEGEQNQDDAVRRSSSSNTMFGVNNHALYGEDDPDDFLKVIEIAAYTHMQQWAESAEIIKKKIYHKDKSTLIQRRRFAFVCCSKLGCNYNLNSFLCCCPYFLCCHTVSKPKKSNNPSLFASNIFGRNIDARYTLICCVFPCCKKCRDLPEHENEEDDSEDDSDDDQENRNTRKNKRKTSLCCHGRASLTLLTSPFIWFDLPIEVVINRGRLLFSVTSQLIAYGFEWIFFFSIAKAELQWPSSDNLQLRPRASILWVTLGCMVLPEIVHASYMVFAPGYALRSPKRKVKQFLLSIFSFARPIYELAWSFKFSQSMPYISLQHQGLIMSDSGLHERWIVWTGLATSLRELPLRVIQLYILTE